MNVELMVLTMNMEARPTMVEDGDGVAEVMNVVTRRATSPPWRRLQRLAYLFTECCRRAAQELNSGKYKAACGAELVEEEKTTVSAGEAISISMRTKREEEGELQHQ